MSQVQYVYEFLGTLAKPSGKVDRDKGIVYGVRIVNSESENGNCYPQPVLRKAIPVYEGAAVNVGHRRHANDHDDPSPKFGVLRVVRESQNGGLEGDLHFNPKHSFAEAFLWACENNPSLYSLSHHALSKWQREARRDGKRVSESIDAVNSVDIVSRGGTTKGIYESSEAGTGTGATSMIDAKAIAGELADGRALEKFLTDLFAALPSGTFTSDVKNGILDKLYADAAPPADAAPTAPAVAPAMESLARRGEVGRWAAKELRTRFEREALDGRKKWANDLCKENGLKAEFVTEAFVGSLLNAGGDAAAKELIADRKKFAVPTGSHQQQRTSPPDRGGAKSAKDLAAEVDFS